MVEQKPSSILKDAREAKGLTLDIVHEATKIPMDALKAIEQGYSVKMLTPFYYRGFIKIYAEFLGMDPQEALTAYNANKPVAIDTQPAFLKKKVASKEAAAPNPVFDQAQDLFIEVWKPKTRKVLVNVVVGIVLLFALVKVGGCIALHIKNRPVAVKEKVKVALPVAPAADKNAERTVKVESASHKAELAVRAIRDNWIQVKADGKTVFAMTLQKGTMERWTASEKIELSGKNIGELDLEINGKHIGSLGERSAKKVVITKDGLTVKK